MQGVSVSKFSKTCTRGSARITIRVSCACARTCVCVCVCVPICVPVFMTQPTSVLHGNMDVWDGRHSLSAYMRVCFCTRACFLFTVTCVSEGTSLEEQVRRIKDLEAIESDSFVPQAFKSSRDDIKTEPVEVKQESERTSSPDVTLPISIIYNDTDSLAHPSLFMDKEKAEELWLTRLVSLRQERLMGSPVT
uniref:Arginine/serine-rich coiled-coil 1 n=1 Tax=Salarias fasciatus TaxID=181472 RepID=A0A672HS35_SALFA